MTCATLLRPRDDALRKTQTSDPILPRRRSPEAYGPASTPADLWVYLRDDQPWNGPSPPAALYRYSPGRGGEHPCGHLEDFQGALQADGYAGFNGLYEPGPDGRTRIIKVAYMAHVRRKFHDVAVSAKGKAPIAAEALRRIGELYAVQSSIADQDAGRDADQDADERRCVRQAEAAPKMAALKAWLEDTLGRIDGKSDTAKAVRYLLNRWDASKNGSTVGVPVIPLV